MLEYRLYTALFVIFAIYSWLNSEHSIWFILSLLFIHGLISALGAYFIQWNLYLNSVNSFKTKRKEVILTFDDGPCEQTTAILDLLDEYNCKASFFCIGENIEKNRDLLQRIHSAGHVIGNHSYYHRNTFPAQSPKSIRKELSKTNTLIESITGEKVRFFRPPFGVTNPLIHYGYRRLGMQSVGWNIRSLDTTARTKEQILRRITRRLRRGAVILLHDSSKDILWIMRELLEYLKENEYNVISLNEITKKN